MSRSRVLLLGAGLVAPPLVRYLLERDVGLTIAANNPERAHALGGNAARVVEWSAGDEATLAQLIGEVEVVVSFLPASMHAQVARLCVSAGRSMVNASYVSAEMAELDEPARAAGVTLLCELGVDPGIDHMSAMQVLDQARARGAHAELFRSYCGGLPAPDANDNPWGYKLSWSPIGVLRAATRAARFLEDGDVVELPAARLFDVLVDVDVGGHQLEGYPNGDSLDYRGPYRLNMAHTLLRGTLRWPGWIASTRALDALSLLADEPLGDAASWLQLLSRIIGVDDGAEPTGLTEAVATRLGVAPQSALLERLSWLGLFDDAPLPTGASTRIEALAAQMSARMAFAVGERDMLVMQHRFGFAERDGSQREEIADLLVFGEPEGDSAMARTVGLPAAIGTRLLLEGRIEARGVLRPLSAAIYQPILAELAEHGIALEHRVI